MNTAMIPDIDRIIEMAWEDRTPFEAIELQFGLKEKHVRALMRREMKSSSFKMWRKRTNDRSSEHSSLRNASVTRFKSHPAFTYYPGLKDSRDWMFPQVQGYYPSFFSFWKNAKNSFNHKRHTGKAISVMLYLPKF